MVTDFIFDNLRLSDFGYIICNFNSTNSDIEISAISDISFIDINSPVSHISHNVTTSYTDNLSKTIQIIKNPCIYNTLEISNNELSELSRWLCRQNYKLFKWIKTNTDDEIFYNVQVKLKKIELGNTCLGLELTIIANTPFGLTKEYISKLSFTPASSKSITVFSDEEGYIYPDTTIVINETGDLKLINTYEERTTHITQCTAGEIITIVGGDILQISSNNKSHDLSKCFNYHFPRLCSKYMNYINIFSANISCNIIMKYRGIRKVGF